MKTTYYVAPEFAERARAIKPDEDIRVDARLLGDNWFAVTGMLPNKGLPPVPPGWREEGKAKPLKRCGDKDGDLCASCGERRS